MTKVSNLRSFTKFCFLSFTSPSPTHARRMEKKSAYLPVPSPRPAAPPKRNKRYLILPILLSLLALFHLSRSQLLFPNQLSNQLPFTSWDLEELAGENGRGEEASSNQVWEGDRAPRIAVIGAGAGGKLVNSLLKLVLRDPFLPLLFPSSPPPRISHLLSSLPFSISCRNSID